MLFVYSHVPWRLLESRPPFTTILHKYPGPANYHRGVWFLWNAQGLLPLPAGWLETWDSGDVWPTQGQRKGKKEKKKACRVWIRRPSLLGLTRLPSGFVCDKGAGLSFPALHGENSPGLRYDLKWYRLILSFWDMAGLSRGSHESRALLEGIYCVVQTRRRAPLDKYQWGVTPCQLDIRQGSRKVSWFCNGLLEGITWYRDTSTLRTGIRTSCQCLGITIGNRMWTKNTMGLKLFGIFHVFMKRAESPNQLGGSETLSLLEIHLFVLVAIP